MDEELCGRWHQMGAFMPMMRNYYNATQNGSELYNMQNFTYQFMSAQAVHQRYQYARYIYSHMYNSFLNGGAVVYPLFFIYPEDANTFIDPEHTYMVGDSLKISPVLQAGNASYMSYFPAGVWADLNNASVKINSTGQNVSLTPLDSKTQVHLKAGKIAAMQKNHDLYKTTADYEQNVKMSFTIMRDDSDAADGYILVDDGISNTTFTQEEYTFWKLRYAGKGINFWVEHGNF